MTKQLAVAALVSKEIGSGLNFWVEDKVRFGYVPKAELRNCYGKVFKLEFLGGGFHSTKYPSKYVDTSKQRFYNSG